MDGAIHPNYDFSLFSFVDRDKNRFENLKCTDKYILYFKMRQLKSSACVRDSEHWKCLTYFKVIQN